MSDLLAENFEEAHEKGFFGELVDPTPNHAYTLEGVGAGEPTPETDAGAKKKAQERIAEMQSRGSEEPKGASKSTATAKASS